MRGKNMQGTRKKTVLALSIAAMFSGVIYEHLGRRSAFGITSVTMTILVVSGIAIAGVSVLRHPSARTSSPTAQ